jgi:acyl-coenzyme A thioesterase PaaI-like protein
MTAPDALFDPVPVPDDAPGDAVEAWTSTEFARGPWDPNHCHGGPVSAMLARTCERIGRDGSDGVDWSITRLTIELMRPVPVGTPLAVTTNVERPGRKVSVVAASLWNGAAEVAKVRALRVRTTSIELPEHPQADPEITVAAGDGRHERVSWAAEAGVVAFHSHGAEHRIIEGSWNDPGPIKVWIRLAVPLIAGEVPSGVQRAAAAADFGNGVSSALDFERFLYINPDLTVHLARPPQGEWIGMSTHSVYGTDTWSTGAGFAESALHDERGRVGRSVQSLLLEER